MSTLLYEVQVTKDAFERFQEKTENGWQVGVWLILALVHDLVCLPGLQLN